jgi:hypothetical protein
VERDFYNFTLLSADETIKHWEAAVDAGRNILWDALSRVMEQSASETMDEYGKALEHSEKLMLKALEAQFDVLKQDKKAILQEAQSVQQKMQTQVKAFSGLQKEVLGGHILQRARDSND